MCFEDECEMFQAWHVGVLRMAVPLGMLEYGVPVCLCPVDPTEWDNHFEHGGVVGLVLPTNGGTRWPRRVGVC